MANHLHLLLRPFDVKELPRLIYWFAWYSAMALNRLNGRCGHFWEARYFSTPIHPKEPEALGLVEGPRSPGFRQDAVDALL